MSINQITNPNQICGQLTDYIYIYIYNPTTIAFSVYWSEFLTTDPDVLASIPGGTRYSEKYWVWNRFHST
jgi:hypothetical protein